LGEKAFGKYGFEGVQILTTFGGKNWVVILREKGGTTSSKRRGKKPRGC